MGAAAGRAPWKKPALTLVMAGFACCGIKKSEAGTHADCEFGLVLEAVG